MNKVTFVHCRVNSSLFVGYGGRKIKINVSYLLKGIHLNSKEGLLFNKATLISPAFKNWNNSFDDLYDISNKSFTIPSPKEILKIEFENLTIKTVNFFQTGEEERGVIQIKQATCFEITTLEFRNISSLLEIIFKLKKFILFLTNQNSEFENYFFYLLNEDGKEVDVEMIHTFPPINEDRFSQYIHIHYSDLKDELNDFFLFWFNSNVSVVIDLLLEKSLNTEMSSKGYFLNTCIAMEAFHRSVYGNLKDGAKENKSKIETIILSSGEEKLLNWYKKESAHMGSTILMERLKKFEPTIKSLLGNSILCDCNGFINAVKRTRNEIAHDGQFNNHFKSEVELFIASKVLEFTLRIEIIKFGGIKNEDSLKEIMTEANRGIKSLIRINYTPTHNVCWS